MPIIPQTVLDGWNKQYEEGAPLWKQYPEITKEQRQHFLDLLEVDRAIVHEFAFRDAEQGKKLYLATAGAPAAGKSTKFEEEINTNPEYKGLVKADPDFWAMKMMTSWQYLMDLGREQGLDEAATGRRAYDIARPASNIFTIENINEAFDKDYGIAHGTTMTGVIEPLLKGMKASGRKVELMLFYAPDDVRVESYKNRSEVEGFYQATPEDVKDKGAMFPQRFELYFDHADTLRVFWRDDAKGPAVEAGNFANGGGEVFDLGAALSFIDQFENDRAKLSGLKAADPEKNKGIVVPPSFDELQERYVSRFFPAPALQQGAKASLKV